MLITSAQANQVTTLAVTMFGAAPGAYKEYLDGVYLANGADLVATAAAFGTEPAFGAMYNGTAAENAAKIIANLSIDQITDAALKSVAETYITDQVTAGADLGQLYGFAIDYMQNNTDGNDFSEALAVIDAKVAVANSFTAGYGSEVTNLDVLMNAIAGVTADTDVDAFVFASLTENRDVIFGDSSDNIFVAGLSADGDTLQSGDYINGDAGTDTLSVTLADTPFAIIPETEGVEILRVQSQADGRDEGNNDPKDPASSLNTIDAQKMVGVTQFWNESSRADLKIEDIQTGSNSTTIGIQSTDSGDVDYEVYFDNITKPGDLTEGSQLNIELVDVLGLGQDGEALSNLLTSEPLVINVGDQEVSVDLTDGKFEEFTGGTVQSQYQALADFIEAAFAGYDVTVELGAEKNAVYSQDADTHSQGDIAGQYFPIIVTNNGPEALSANTWIIGAAGETTDVAKTIENVEPGTISALTATNIYLDDAGQGSAMGDFLAGNMSTGASSGSQGIQQFNVTVNRDSWLNTMDTTNNSLEVMNVVNDTENGDFTLNQMSDVRVFDASTMTGSVTLGSVALTDAVVAKYMDLKDDATDSSADNSDPVSYVDVVDTEFSYDFGAGDDTMSMTLSAANLEAAGTTTREDFVLEIDGGAGADSITTEITGGFSVNGLANAKENANLAIEAGAGDDTVTTLGSGDFVINAGSGNDTVYVDNSATKAAWIVNATNADSADLDSNGTPLAGTTDSLLYGAQLTVTLNDPTNALAAVAGTSGYESTVTIGTQNYLGTEANVNQAIKDAINNDAVLSKLLVAQDGPANTLVISSLIDGVFEADDLDFTVAAATLADMSTSNAAALDTAWETLNADSTLDVAQGDLDAAAATVTAQYVGVLDTNGSNIGADSVASSDNTVDLGTGDDVLVLGTGTGSDTDTVVFTGSAIGNNTIVNFALAEDVLDFTSYLTNVTSASGSSESEVAIATTSTVEAAAAIDLTASEVAIVNDFAANGSETWANMTASAIDDALTAGVAGNGDIYGNIDDAATTTTANIVGTTQTSILMVQNDADDGEYKVFEVTETIADNSYAVTLLGTVDFGYEIDATTVVA